MEPVAFGIVGGGWRAECFLSVSQSLAHRFHVAGMLVRDAARGSQMERTWGVPTYRTLDALVTQAQPRFVVVAVAKAASLGVLEALAARGTPASADSCCRFRRDQAEFGAADPLAQFRVTMWSRWRGILDATAGDLRLRDSKQEGDGGEVYCLGDVHAAGHGDD